MNTIRRLGLVAAASSGAVFSYYVTSGTRTVNASWTTGYTPSVKWDWNWDGRDTSSILKPNKEDSSVDENNNKVRSKAIRHIILIRHGQYTSEGATGDDDMYLSKLGREQAAYTGERLKALSLPLTRIVYSTMARAAETAKIIHGNLDKVPIEQCDMLREGAPIPPEPPIESGWNPELHEFYTDGARIEAAFRKYIHRAPPSQEKDSYDVLVCHGNVIRYFVCRALQLPPEAWLRLSVRNGSMTYLCVGPNGKVSLKELGDAGYMPPSALTFN